MHNLKMALILGVAAGVVTQLIFTLAAYLGQTGYPLFTYQYVWVFFVGFLFALPAVRDLPEGGAFAVMAGFVSLVAGSLLSWAQAISAGGGTGIGIVAPWSTLVGIFVGSTVVFLASGFTAFLLMPRIKGAAPTPS